MGTRISINVTHGSAQVTDEDRDRAEKAALAVLEHGNINPAEAFTDFKRQWEEFDDYDRMTGLASVWIDAERAADLALTEGWHNTAGASCTISA